MHFPDAEESGDVDMTVTDERESLINDICNYMLPFAPDIQEAKNMLYMLVSPYEITSRCTEIVVQDEERNEYLLKKFLIAKKVNGCTPRTLVFYNCNIQGFFREIKKTVDDITADDIRCYMAIRQRRDGISQTTLVNTIRSVSSFFTWLVAEELVQKNPVMKLGKIKNPKTKLNALTELEVEKMRAVLTDDREKLIIEMLLSTGCRVTELSQILLSEIDGTKILIHGKGQKDRYVYLNARAELTLKTYLQQRKDNNPYLFPRMKSIAEIPRKGISQKAYISWWKKPEFISEEQHITKDSIEIITKRVAKRAGVEQANPHKFRRTCATMALRRGMPVEQVSKMLGHEKLETTQIYLDLTEDELEQAHKKYVV